MSTDRSVLQRSKRLKNQQRWREHVFEQARGKLTQREYCRVHRLGYASFVRWRGIIRQKSQPADVESGFMPIIVEAPPEVTDGTKTGLSVVLSNGTRIDGITATSVSVVAALVAVL